MKFKKEEKKELIIFVVITIILMVSFISFQYLIQDKIFDEYRSILQNISMLTYGIAVFLAFFLGSFFVYLRFGTDENGQPFGDHKIKKEV